MHLQAVDIHNDSFVADIVKQDYRSAAVFQQFGISFCCGGRWPLSVLCENNGLDIEEVKRALLRVLRPVSISSSLPFDSWGIDFLADYILHVHHQYLKDGLPRMETHLNQFIQEHLRKYPFLEEVAVKFKELQTILLPHLLEEEEIVFPYLRQLAHAYENREPYAGLLVRTLGKPVEKMMHLEQESVAAILKRVRELTGNYIAPANACTSHRVAYSLLHELDHDLSQHLYLENNFLFPKAIAMEKELYNK